MMVASLMMEGPNVGIFLKFFQPIGIDYSKNQENAKKSEKIPDNKVNVYRLENRQMHEFSKNLQTKAVIGKKRNPIFNKSWKTHQKIYFISASKILLCRSNSFFIDIYLCYLQKSFSQEECLKF